jgi:hypothetical protein
MFSPSRRRAKFSSDNDRESLAGTKRKTYTGGRSMANVMSGLGSILLHLEGTRIAKVVANSLALTAGLSAIHLIGFTLLMGGAIVSNLRLAGVLLTRQTLVEIRRPAERGMLAGLCISVTTGVLLFSARASEASQNMLFQFKMAALVAAFVFQFVLQRRLVSTTLDPGRIARATGMVGLILWFTLAIAACAFVLLE